VPNALAHKQQLRRALRRAGVQPRLEVGMGEEIGEMDLSQEGEVCPIDLPEESAAEQPPPETGTFGIGIEANVPSAYIDGIHYIAKDYGHTYADVKDADGDPICVYSVGPDEHIEGNELKFVLTGLRGKTNYPIDEESKTWEWPLREKQYQACKGLFESAKSQSPTYSPSSQCTSSALKLAKACKVSTPSGRGPISLKGTAAEKIEYAGFISPIAGAAILTRLAIGYPNPYRLDDEMSRLPSPKPQKVPPGTYNP
jgi:hypothetical protein